MRFPAVCGVCEHYEPEPGAGSRGVCEQARGELELAGWPAGPVPVRAAALAGSCPAFSLSPAWEAEYLNDAELADRARGLREQRELRELREPRELRNCGNSGPSLSHQAPLPRQPAACSSRVKSVD